MYPILLKLGPLNVYAYGTFLALAVLTGDFLIYKAYQREGLSGSFIFDLSFWILISGIIGARVLYCLLNLAYFSKDLPEIFKLQHGGLSWFGGLVFGVSSAIIYLKVKKTPVLNTIDKIIPYVALAQAIGRIGCFSNGCCFGRLSAYGIYFPVHDAYLAPVQIYSSLALIIIFFILRVWQKAPHKKGDILYGYFILYGLKRFLMEYFRGDTEYAFLGLTVFQVFSLSLFVLGVALLVFNRTRCRS